LGGRAISYSTVYDQRLAPLSLGTVIQWETHQAAWEKGAPQVIDYLPGKGTYKSRLGTLAPRLLVITAARRSLVTGLALPLRGTARKTARRTVHLARKVGAKVGPARSLPRSSTPGEPTPVRSLVITPTADDAPCPIERLAPSTSTELFLAVAGGWPSPRAMKAGWQEEDTWWLVGRGPRAAIRLGRADAEGEPLPVREIVHFEASGASAEALLGNLSGALGRSLLVHLPSEDGSDFGTPVRIHHALLPWPRSTAPAC
ncbi:MAG TPA: GNAT family N-acetyltransferase, partial [Acidobacteria bacterium]|nr:GNAT family N-acetyltransferase [Acidobacteriota bacterium]